MFFLKLQKVILFATTLFIGVSLIGCSDTSNGNGAISIGITDAPVDEASNVFVQFNSLEFKPADGQSIVLNFDETKTIDLLALQGGKFEMLVDTFEVQPGNYNWLRLGVIANENEMDSYINLENGSSYSLYIPSGEETGLKINRKFVVTVGGTISMIVDFDLRKSVMNPAGKINDYILKPVLRMTDNSQTGFIMGSISASALTDPGCNEGKAVYLYADNNVVADDIGSSASPLITALLNYNADTDRWEFEIGFVEEGDYTVAVTCDGDVDQLESDEAAWQSISSANVNVTAENTSSVALD